MTESTLHVPGESTPASPSPARRSRAVWWFAVPAVSGVMLGVLWWVLAPGGLNVISGNPELGDPANPDTWLPRDLVLAALMLVSGCATGLLLDGKLQGEGAGIRLASAVAGGGVGAVIAWVVGLQAAQFWGAASDPAYGFSLRSYAVLFLWPGAIAFLTFVLALFGVLSHKPVK
ncbi:hypothetical protein AB0N65_11990 [Paenarthrobacter sp. NPDC089322]|uniref:hypothetical protein n=1 Tax=Paenarthrobacter sp. NPDC089322 TaxID=3155065 RepID=UPI00343DAC8E